MKNREITIPSGRFTSLATSAYMNTAVTSPKAIAGNLEPPRQAESVTAKAAEDIIASTPVA
jgi:hypothetical protein